jgi:signal transduction histidine kinase
VSTYVRTATPTLKLAAVSIAAVLLLLALIDISPRPLDTVITPRVENARLDASRWNFAELGPISLSGNWHFRDGSDVAGTHRSGTPNHFGSVPGAWPVTKPGSAQIRADGVGIYTLDVDLPPVSPHQQLAIDTGYWLSAYRVFANGQLLIESGRVANSREAEIGNAYSKIVPLPVRAGRVELRYEVSNHISAYGGAFAAPKIGLMSDLSTTYEFLKVFSSFLVGAMFFASVYHLVLFMIDARNFSLLWFALFAAILGIRTLTIEPLAGSSVYWLTQDWVWRIDFAASILLLPTSYQFFQTSFPRNISAGPSPLFWGFGLTNALLTFVAGPAFGEFAIKAIELIAMFVIPYLTVALGIAFFRREEGALLAFCGWILCAGAVIHDILLNNGIIESINLIPFGFIAFFLCVSGMLAARFRRAFQQAEGIASRLGGLNEELEDAVRNRTAELEVKLEELHLHQNELERAREEAISANIAKSRFLTTISHELRTPLNSILGFSEIIRDERLGSAGDPRYPEYAGHINESGTHLLDLISDILDLSRIESGKLVLRFEEVRVPDAIDAAIAKAATRERRAGDCVRVEVDPALPMIHADGRAVTQMVINLVSNALKFTPDEGSVTLRAFQRTDGGVTIEVADTGIGMAPDEIPLAIVAFSQIDNDLSRRHEGTGLGLTIVNAMMQQHGGSLAIDSEKGRGTRVRLDFTAERSIRPSGELRARAG